MMTRSLFVLADDCLRAESVDEKIRLTEEAARLWRENSVDILPLKEEPGPCLAGHPSRPKMVESFQLPKRSKASNQYQPAFVHALAHIEFNAVNLAWDAVYRFRNMPNSYYDDWVRVAAEEAHHFSLLRSYLIEQGSDYGHFDAHDGLWRMAQQTSHDVMVRMALVPRVLEARGLDVTPGMIAKLKQNNENSLVEILEIIYRDEIGHVEIGSRWFQYCCEQRRLDSQSVFASLVEAYAAERIKKPINDEARLEAGFDQHELDYLYTYL